MLCVPTSAALPSKGPFSFRLVDLSENRIGLIANRSQCDYQRVERPLHNFNSSCSDLPVNLRDSRAQKRNNRAFMFI